MSNWNGGTQPRKVVLFAHADGFSVANTIEILVRLLRYRGALLQPAATASASEQNQRSPL
jgi:hypothetical protein